MTKRRRTQSTRAAQARRRRRLAAAREHQVARSRTAHLETDTRSWTTTFRSSRGAGAGRTTVTATARARPDTSRSPSGGRNGARGPARGRARGPARRGRRPSWAPRRQSALRLAALVLLAVGVAAWATSTGWYLTDDPEGRPGAMGGQRPDTAGAAGGVQPGVTTWVDVRDDGSQQVTQSVRTSEPVDEVTLDLATARAVPGPGRVERLEVVVDGEAVLSRDAVPGGSVVLPETVRLDDPSTELEVRYTRTGAVLRSTTVAGRALVSVTPLVVSVPGPVAGVHRVVVTGGELLSMTCDRPASTAPRPCGAATEGGGWAVRLAPEQRRAPVQAQLDLPVG